jgi:signal transduction histidine kinase
MRQLLQNLIGNAIKFRRPGVAPRVEVTAGPAPRGDAEDVVWELRVALTQYCCFRRMHRLDSR